MPSISFYAIYEAVFSANPFPFVYCENNCASYYCHSQIGNINGKQFVGLCNETLLMLLEEPLSNNLNFMYYLIQFVDFMS